MHTWAVNNLMNMPLNAVTELLKILKDEGSYNLVQLRNNEVFIINQNLLKIERYEAVIYENVFISPCPSQDVGLIKIKEFSESMELIPLKKIKTKCISFKVENKTCNFFTSLWDNIKH